MRHVKEEDVTILTVSNYHVLQINSLTGMKGRKK
jgi:hypothetical protein